MKRKIERFNPFVYMIRSLFGMFIIVMISLISLILLSYFLSATPKRTIYYFFSGPFSSLYAFGNMINDAIPLIIGGLGVSLAFRAGNMNIGGEGQVYTGALIATIVAIALEGFGEIGVVLSIFLAMAASGLLAGFSGYLKAKWNTNELITTFLVSNAMILIVNYLISGPFVDPLTNLISTRQSQKLLNLPSFFLPQISIPPL